MMNYSGNIAITLNISIRKFIDIYMHYYDINISTILNMGRACTSHFIIWDARVKLICFNSLYIKFTNSRFNTRAYGSYLL